MSRVVNDRLAQAAWALVRAYTSSSDEQRLEPRADVPRAEVEAAWAELKGSLGAYDRRRVAVNKPKRSSARKSSSEVER